jgi:hypothetical protein
MPLPGRPVARPRWEDPQRPPIKLAEYPTGSHCWICGRFGSGGRAWPQRSCARCDVTWYQLLPGVNPREPLDRSYEHSKARKNYLGRSVKIGRAHV